MKRILPIISEHLVVDSATVKKLQNLNIPALGCVVIRIISLFVVVVDITVD